jgi:hypothetical protein
MAYTNRAKIKIRIGSFKEKGHWLTVMTKCKLTDSQVEKICESLKQTIAFNNRRLEEGDSKENGMSSTSSSVAIWGA